jgi:hypothetical protein
VEGQYNFTCSPLAVLLNRNSVLMHLDHRLRVFQKRVRGFRGGWRVLYNQEFHVWDLRISTLCGMWRHPVWQIFGDVLEEPATSIIRVEI